MFVDEICKRQPHTTHATQHNTRTFARVHVLPVVPLLGAAEVQHVYVGLVNALHAAESRIGSVRHRAENTRHLLRQCNNKELISIEEDVCRNI
jgi:hypothetical protein